MPVPWDILERRRKVVSLFLMTSVFQKNRLFNFILGITLFPFYAEKLLSKCLWKKILANVNAINHVANYVRIYIYIYIYIYIQGVPGGM